MADDWHYECLSHHLFGWTSWTLLIFYVIYHSYHQRNFRFGASKLPYLWIGYLCSQVTFCSIFVTRCEIIDNSIIFLCQILAVLLLSVFLFVNGLYIILSLKNNELYSFKKIIIILIIYYIIAVVLFFILGLALKSELAVALLIIAVSYIGFGTVSFAIYRVYKSPGSKGNKFYFYVFLVSLIGVLPGGVGVLGHGVAVLTTQILLVFFGTFHFQMAIIEMDTKHPLFSNGSFPKNLGSEYGINEKSVNDEQSMLV